MKITEYEISDKYGLKIAVLADTHNMPSEKILALLSGIRPDVICHVGDIVHHKTLSRSPNSEKLIKGCVAIAPTLFSAGNHDDDHMEKGEFGVMRDMGVKVLENTVFHIGGVTFGGFPSLLHRDTKAEKKSVDLLKSFAKESGFKVLLCHHPEYFDRYDFDKSADLIISGHVHGGQIRLFGHGLFSPGQGLFPKYSKGLYHEKLIVSAGLANTGGIFIPRVFNEPEILLIKL